MNLKEHIIETNNEKLDDWNLLNWDNPNPYDYRYYKMLGLALFERVCDKNAFSLDIANPVYYFDRGSPFLMTNSYIIYGLHKNSILDFKLILSLYDAYLYYFLYFINRNNIDSKFYKEYTITEDEKEFKSRILSKSIYYTLDDLPKILKGKKLVYGDSPNTYKDFLIGMYQMALMMRWRAIYNLCMEVEHGVSDVVYEDTYNQAFNTAYNSLMKNFVKMSSSRSSSPSYRSQAYVATSRRKDINDNWYFIYYITADRDITISCYQKLLYDSVAELYLGSSGSLSGYPVESSNIDYFGDSPFLTSSLMLYDRKTVNKNEIISFKVEDLQKNDYMIELPDYDKDETFSISKYYGFEFLIIYDCNNSYKLKAN